MMDVGFDLPYPATAFVSHSRLILILFDYKMNNIKTTARSLITQDN